MVPPGTPGGRVDVVNVMIGYVFSSGFSGWV